MRETTIALTELEDAINYWRIQRPASVDCCALSPEVSALAELYAWMIIDHLHDISLEHATREVRQLLDLWQDARMARRL
jgi:hypothetical protein